MRFITQFLFLFLINTLAVQSKEPFKINGKMGDYNAPTKIFFVYKDLDGKLIEDSCNIKNGIFSFIGEAEYPFLAHLYLAVDGNRSSVKPDDALSLYVEPGEISIEGKVYLSQAIISGSKTNDLDLEFQRMTIPLQEKATRIQSSFANASPELQNNAAFRDSLDIQFDSLKEEYNSMALTFIIKHPESMLGVYMLQSEINVNPNNPSIEAVFETLSEKVRNSKPGEKLKASIERYRTLPLGEKAPLFSADDINGKKVSLDDFNGEYLLLVFFSPTCDHCLAEITELKENYFKYKDKGFNIVSFAVELPEGKQDWLDVVKDKKIDWPSISDLKLWDSEIVRSYKVYGVPMNYLINSEGVVIAKELYGAKLSGKLNSIFNE